MRKPTRPRMLAAAVALGAALVVGVAGASAGSADEHGAGASTPRHDSQVDNLGQVKNQIKAYYGDNGDHNASADSNYARDAHRVEAQLTAWLRTRKGGAKPAVVFDVDDTVLLNYTYEASHDFGYDPTTNAECVAAECFPAVFGMVDVVTWASDHGFAVFYVTGRPSTQQDDTLANLTKVGLPKPAGIFTKVKTAPYPSYLPCSPNCSTIEYKSGTRAHIEDEGYRIVANVGDQYSDLKGGHAARTFKMPNPMYYLP
ncbi:MAG TPA: HAD family acid phosphatase [Actinocatenispora sp.]